MSAVVPIDRASTQPSDVEERDRVGQFVLVFLAFANVFDMGGGFGLKYLSYALCALLLIARRDELRVSRSILLLSVVLFVAWPLISAMQGISRGADLGRALQRMTAFIPALLVLPLLASSRAPRVLLDAIMNSLLALAIVVILIFGSLVLVPISSYPMDLLYYLREAGHGYFGARSLGSLLIPNVYFKATLFLVPACTWFLFKRRYLAAATCFLALVLAFSRAGALLAGLVICGYALMLASIRVRVVFACLLLGLVYVLWTHAELLQMGAFLDMYLDVLTGRGQSAGERLGHFSSIIELLSQNPGILWLGQGTGVAFFSSGVNAFVWAVELDHLDAIRSFGLIWFIGFTLVVMRAAGVGLSLETQEARGLRVAVIAGFLAAGTNPVLINPLFCILVVAAYYFHAAGQSTRPS